ncbi:MAG: hypothetical protein SWZ49_26730 [Cyanobacteriota bacterium]|nr:hypothetical protein [Cyanobacteriota bacterium]
MSYILLRDIPKQSVQLDFLLHQIQGGFRGFQEVPPGFHYGAVLSQGQWRNFWCYLQPETVLVKRFDSELQKCIDDTPENTAEYTQLAIQNSMNRLLISYPIKQYSDWQSLTQYITTDSPVLHIEVSQSLSGEVNQDFQPRFEKTFLLTHQSDIKGFLSEFQYAFLRWFMTTKEKVDEVAQKRWTYLLNGMYNAGESAIKSYPELFSEFIDVYLAQLAQLPGHVFTNDSVICKQLNYLIEDINDTEISGLRQKARILATYIKHRQAQIK